MRRYFPALTILFFLFTSILEANEKQIETLRVALYPIVPEYRELFFKLEAMFEASHPVNLELVETYVDPKDGKTKSLADGYYKGGLLKAEADVYEIDTVLLDQMVKKIRPITLPKDAYFPGTIEAVQFEGKTWAVPHWICGNFVFYHKADQAIEQAKTLEELLGSFQNSSGLLFDMKGTSTLGEWYLTGLASNADDIQKILETINLPNVDRTAVATLESLLRACPAGYCRSNAFHYRAGYYARLFAHKKARAYIGYSESIHYALREINDNCGPIDGCLSEREIAVRALPPMIPQGRQVGWVDALAISANLTEEKAKLALEFIQLVTSKEGYGVVLEPAWPEPPRYLLPAVMPESIGLNLSPALYPNFYSAFGSRILLTAKDLNNTLRSRAAALECMLPHDRGDMAWQENCPQH